MNINDIAKASGVSVATVSRVLNDSSRVSQKTKDRILEVIKETGYHPSMIGKSLREKNTHLILVLITSVVNTYYAKVIKGIESVALSRGYYVVIANSYDKKEYEEAYLPLLTKRMVDGIILASSWVAPENLAGISSAYPIVQCGENFIENVPFVSIDNVGAAYDIVKLMIKKGKRRIATLSVDNSKPSTTDRMEGYKRALEESGLQFDENLIMYGNYGFRNALMTTEKFLTKNPDIDGIFAISDRMAAGAIRAAKKFGKRVPDDIAVSGFDDVDIAYTVEPGITTVSQNQEEMGKAAATMLIERINGKSKDNTQRIIPYEIKIRDSI
ncbi:MAG: LacI family DNA-binding transcriptional regulator [Bacillota bacterium]|nr:LacI family DNA-binding transcriptional regulator [Bacillota bacterium]